MRERSCSYCKLKSSERALYYTCYLLAPTFQPNPFQPTPRASEVPMRDLLAGSLIALMPFACGASAHSISIPGESGIYPIRGDVWVKADNGYGVWAPEDAAFDCQEWSPAEQSAKEGVLFHQSSQCLQKEVRPVYIRERAIHRDTYRTVRIDQESRITPMTSRRLAVGKRKPQ